MEDIVENQKLVLCNFSGQENIISSEDAYLIGTLLINEIINYCKTQRLESRIAKQKPFFLMIDEAHRFLSMKISEALAECAKNGLHLALAHQNLAQLREYSEILYQNVMTNAQTKILFGGLPHSELEILEKDFFAGDHDFKKIKDEIYRTTVVDYVKETRMLRGGSRSTSSANSHFKVNVEGQGSAHSVTSLEPDGQLNLSQVDSADSETLLESSSNSSSFGTGSAEVQSESESWSETLMLTPILDKELASRQFYNLEELRELNISRLKNTPQQHCFIKVRNRPVQSVMVKTILEIRRDEEKINKAHQVSQEKQSQYYLPVPKIQALISDKERTFQEKADFDEPENFRE